MLLLLFYVGNDRYALESRRVIQVFPNLTLKQVHHAPDYIPGLFNYRGQIVPVLDLSQLIRGTASPDLLSTRIILVREARTEPTAPTACLLGLRAERVTTTLDVSETALKSEGMKVDAAPYLGKIVTDAQGMIQLICLEHLLSETQSIALLSGGDE